MHITNQLRHPSFPRKCPVTLLVFTVMTGVTRTESPMSHCESSPNSAGSVGNS